MISEMAYFSCNHGRTSCAKPLSSVTYLAMANNVARQVAETIAESRIEFYQSLHSVAPANENVPLTSCDHRKRDKLQEIVPYRCNNHQASYFFLRSVRTKLRGLVARKIA